MSTLPAKPSVVTSSLLETYQEAVMRTGVPTDIPSDRLKLALIGLQDELGEIAGPLKQYLWHGHTFDIAHLEEEIGDLLWYLALLCNTLNIALSEVLARNISKLHERYPDGFSQERSQQRVEQGERGHDHQ